jgi:hypothetical protein
MTDATIDVLEADKRPPPPYTGWTDSHPLNVRLSIPLGSARYYLTLVGGREKRGPSRRAEDRLRYPLRTAANLIFFLGLAVVVYVAALFVLAVQTSLIEF